jgi:methylamine dehydrogenase heavy chain
LSVFAAPLMAALATAGTVRAELPSDIGAEPTSAVLQAPASKHWVWVNDMVFSHMSDGGAHLVDGDSGRYLGSLSTGYSARIVLSGDGKVIYSPETYFSRGTRGERTDVVTLYDAATLAAVGEISIPVKRSSNMPAMGNSVLTDDGRFLLIFNFNPSASVSVVDLASRKFVGEIETPGCALIYPTGTRSFFTLCGDLGAEVVTLDDSGAVLAQDRAAPLFDIGTDLVTERPVRLGNTWYFVSFDGRICPIVAGKGGLVPNRYWWLTSAAERRLGWRPGGLQTLAVHAGENRLYVIMHQGNRDTHKDPGKVIWVYDLAMNRRIMQIATRHLTGSIQVSADDQPLLYGVFADSTSLDIYDAQTGKPLRTVKDVATTPTILVTP